MFQPHSLLLTDLYQLNMMQAYHTEGLNETAVFEFFVRKMPADRGFFMAAGLQQLVEFLETMEFSREDLDYLDRTGRFTNGFLEYLETFRFTGDLDAMSEGTIFFPAEPVARITAPLPEAQLVETRLINQLQLQSLIASKAARMVLAAPGKRLVDFGLRRAHGSEAGLFAARAAYLAGFEGTATVLADAVFNIPIYGTMAHSYIEAHDSETAALEAFARARPQNVVLLIDTYDTERCAEKVVGLAPRLAADGITIRGVRIDSGDLADHARKVRRILDDGGLNDVIIFASGGLDEDKLLAHAKAGAPIDGYGIGTSLTVSDDVPALDCAYKLEEYAGVARRKRSEGKATWPGRKQVFRHYGGDGRMSGDVLTVEGDAQEGEALVRPVMRHGKRVASLPTLDEARDHAKAQLERLPERLARLEHADYPVEITPALRDLADEVDRRVAAARET